MKIKNLYMTTIKRYCFIILISGISFTATAQKPGAGELFRSSVFTPLNSFTSGVEGPAVDKSGILYAVNFEHDSTIGRILPNGIGKIFLKLPNGSIGNGLRFNNRGDMLIADYTNHNILKVDMSTKQIQIFAHEPGMNQPNDIAIDSKDRLYASDPNWKDSTGSIWRVDLNGKVTLLEENMGTANGIEVSPDEKTLYVNESVQRNVWAYNLSDGKISNKRLLIRFEDYEMDGMRCDIKGNLYIARYGKGTIVKVSPTGKILKEIILAGKNPSNVAFGGKDGRTIYVTVQDKGNIETFRVDTPGREWKMMRND
jgi:sugar lactone lactonase YvrE